MAKKPDLSGIKNFLFDYGEKIALGVCGFTAVLLLVMGFIGSSGAGSGPSGKSWADEIKGKAQQIESQMQSAAVVDLTAEQRQEIDPEHYRWRHEVSNFVPGPFISLAEQTDLKRRNPQILGLKAEADTMQLDYLRGLYFRYDTEPTQKRVWTFKDEKTAVGGPGGGLGGIRPPTSSGEAGGASGGAIGDAAAAANIVKDAKARRMVVAHLTFPMKDQVEMYRKAFRLNDQSELFAQRDSLPKPVGLNVVRYEVLPDGKFGPAVPVYVNRPMKGLEVARSTDELMRDAMFDEEQNALYETYLFAGLATPLPQLANATYPALNLTGLQAGQAAVDLSKSPNGAAPKRGMAQPMIPGIPGMRNPKGPMGAAASGNAATATREIAPVTWSTLAKRNAALKPLVERFGGLYDVFHPLGLLANEDQKAAAPGGRADMTPPSLLGGPAGTSGMGGPAGAAYSFNPFDRLAGTGGTGSAGVTGSGPMMPKTSSPLGTGGPLASPGQGNQATVWDTDALVRFIDLDVEPGKTYRYHVQVRMANPNFGRKNDVVFIALSEIKELYSPWTLTGEVSIPGEFQFYAVDQALQDSANNLKVDKNAFKFNPQEQTAFQIHRWFEKGEDRSVGPDALPIGDWAIAERLLVRRGESIGHPGIPAEVPYWNKKSESFVVPEMSVREGRYNVIRKGLPLDFVVTVPPPLLVDFEGGRRQNQRVGFTTIHDESAVDALILMPDGRLIVHNSRHDTDQSNDTGKLRAERLEQARTRVREAAAPPAATAPGGWPGRITLPGQR